MQKPARRIFDVNVHGTMSYSRFAVQRWLERGAAGVVVNLGSVAATTGAPGEYLAYAASKAAVETFTRGLGKELGPQGIRVVAVSPGTTTPPFTPLPGSGAAGPDCGAGAASPGWES
ncbi:SDR family oxidoreductase [Arthrobacter crystallopoietes]|uniref:SDR family oxidoreductase n=1 Tax=Crystallibacter crystallopoietes TaxID=37928 RepID=UPI001F0DD510|nr:SDR family oxidoreductase [Arthrobacter crystallopoietes]